MNAFGALCPGKRYALLNLKWYILTVLSKFDLRYTDPTEQAQYDYNYYGHEILPPVNDINIQVRHRTSAPHIHFQRQ